MGCGCAKKISVSKTKEKPQASTPVVKQASDPQAARKVRVSKLVAIPGRKIK
jgi:hypothetical protein